MRLVLWCVLLLELIANVLVWLALMRECGKERRMGEIVNVSASIWHHGPNDCI